MQRSILAAVAAGSVMFCGAANAQAPKLPELPPALKSGLSPYLEVSATGVQIYACGKNDAGAFAWVFKAPEAALFDAQKKQIGKHYAGPSWEGMQGGKIVGAAKGTAPAQGCDEAHAGQEARVPYTATYVFLK